VARRFAWLVWIGTAVAVALAQLGEPHHTARGYFDLAARLLVGGTGAATETGLHLYRAHPEFQFGPPAAVAMLPFTLAGSSVGGVLLTVALLATGLLLLGGLLAIARRLVGTRFEITGAVVVGGVALTATWSDLAVRTGHIDDVLALSALVLAVLCATRGRPWTGSVVLGIGAAAKPWGLGFAAVGAAAPGPARWWRPVVAGGVALACWAPFIAAESETLRTSSHGIEVRPESVLALFGLAGATTPGWCRPVQLVAGLVVAAALVARGRWAAAPLAVVIIRLLLDPDVNRYYTVAFVLVALLWCWLHHPDRFPALAVAGALVLESTELLPGPDVGAALVRLLFLVVAAVVVLRSAPSPPLPTPSPIHRDRAAVVMSSSRRS
jgi:hypothetical protein